MSVAVSEIYAEIARLVAAGADPWQLAGARERRAVAERNDDRRKLVKLIDRLDACRESRRGARISAEELRLLLDEIYLLKGQAIIGARR